jgi:hypothetical protein
VAVGEEDAVVLKAEPWNVHGVEHLDVTLAYIDGKVESARLGAGSVPDGLKPGDRVIASKAANIVVEIRRP